MFATIPLYLFCKRYKATIDMRSSLTKVGEDVAKTAMANGYSIKEKTLILGNTRKMVKVVTIMLGTRMERLKPIECIVDNFTPTGGVVLGLCAMATLGYRLVVDQVPAIHHTVARKPITKCSMARAPATIPEEPFPEEEVIEALTDAERREIESWK